MKKQNIILSIILLAFTLTSCGDDFLEIVPVSADTEADYYKTEAEIFAALVAAYDPLQWSDFYGGFFQLQFMSDVRSDDIYVGGAEGDRADFYHEMAEFNMDPLKVPTGMWKMLYTGVNRSNVVIEKMGGVENISDENKNLYLAEAYFLRAYYYHWLWKFWGNIPYYDKNLTAPYMAKQLSADEIYKLIMQDLDNALVKIENDYVLPRTVETANLGRITRYTAMMLKARVVMYQNDESRYQEVYNEMNSIRMSLLFGLMSDFAGVWTNEGEFQIISMKTESIWEINHRSYGGSYDWAEGGEGTSYPTFIGIPDLANDTVYNSGWGYSPVREDIYNLYANGDIRRDASIINFEKRQHEYESVGIELTYKPRYQDTKYFAAKYAPRKGYNDIEYDTDLNYNNNVRVFRYAETLLNLAELSLKLGAGNPQVFLDMVRSRAFGGSYDNSHRYYRNATLDNIIEERRLEFMGEGMRFWDLVRTGKTGVLTETNSKWLRGSRTWADYLKYIPIPKEEIDRTEGEYKLVQNLGYQQ